MRLHAQQVIPAEWALTILTLFLVCLRLYVRAVREAVFDLSDGVVLFAWILSIGSVICDTAAIRLHMWRSRVDYVPHYITIIPRIRRRETAMKLLFASAFPYYVELWSVKVAMLMFYYQTFPKKMKRTRKCLNFVAVVVGGSFFAVMGLTLFWCMPIHLNWSTNPTENCVIVSGNGYEPFYIITGLHLFTDLLILLIPIPYLRTLTPRRAQKVGVGLLYVAGILYMSCTIVRTIAITLHANIPTVGLITCIERAMSIMVVCLPPLKSLYGPRRSGSDEELQQPRYLIDPNTGDRIRNTSVGSSWRRNNNNGNGKSRNMQQNLSVTSNASQDRTRRAVDGWVKSTTRPPSDASDISAGRVISAGRSIDGADPIAQYKRAYGDRIIADRSNPDQRASFEYR